MLHARPHRLQTGVPYPLGATPDGLGVNFAVFSAHATKIELCIFDEGGRKEVARLPLPECTNEVWHGYLPDAGPGLQYACARTAPTSLNAVTASTPTNCCSTRMRASSRARCAGAMRSSVTA